HRRNQQSRSLTVVSLFLGTVALLSSNWCVGKQKVPKPLCTPTKHSNCIPVPGVSNSSSIQFSWETGDDRFVFPTFHTGLFLTCEENIYTDEKCRGFYTLTPVHEKAMMWLSLSLELMYIGLLLISCVLLSVQLCIRAWFPSTQRWGQLLNSFAAVFTVLGGLLGMVGHMMFMQVFQTTASMGPEDFRPHSYGFSWFCLFCCFQNASEMVFTSFLSTFILFIFFFYRDYDFKCSTSKFLKYFSCSD
uniref:Germ cell associated 1 n=1 Tax=Sphaeramia orbicularis TaxID=375764 RepID=A0A672YI26_9TELE